MGFLDGSSIDPIWYFSLRNLALALWQAIFEC